MFDRRPFVHALLPVSAIVASAAVCGLGVGVPSCQSVSPPSRQKGSDSLSHPRYWRPDVGASPSLVESKKDQAAYRLFEDAKITLEVESASLYTTLVALNPIIHFTDRLDGAAADLLHDIGAESTRSHRLPLMDLHWVRWEGFSRFLIVVKVDSELDRDKLTDLLRQAILLSSENGD